MQGGVRVRSDSTWTMTDALGREVGMEREKISEEDYYRRNVEFRAWLLTHDRHFDALSSEKARKYFGKFVERWNAGTLKESIYELEKTAERQGKNRPSLMYRSSHDWNIKDHGDTFVRGEGNDGDGPRRGDFRHEEMKDPISKETRAKDRRRWEKKREADLDELCPKPDPGSFAGRQEKRRKFRQGSPDRMGDVHDASLYGEERGIHEIIERRRHKREEKHEQIKRAAEDRIRDIREKEQKRMDEFKAKFGLS
uniref:Uncharacterized protein n=1 Tax=Compsopogon caeruleus TaxID=31354 RepID=A0A7S1XDZ7_9RHOD|mmetsp:Transcript_1983/g.3549  ORF Transcript_1983/g.3549 Transcript_1983/m.3549 type:complete len:253 (+) Transcript_1983:3-761(+)